MRMKTIAVAISAIGMMAAVAPAFAGEVEDLKAAMKVMMERIDQLEAQQKAQAQAQAAAPKAAVPANVVTTGDLPNSIRIPGTDTSVKLYAYAQLDATYDRSGRNININNTDWASIVAANPLDKSAAGHRTGQLYSTVRTSRIGLESSTPTDQGPLKVKIEADFNSPASWGPYQTNSAVFRVRHAYGELGNWLVGQTWTNFADLGSYADTVDFNGPGTVPLVRQPQVRYTLPVGATSKLALSVENPYSDAITATTAAGQSFNRVPDFIANFTTTGTNGAFSIRAVSLQYRDDANTKQGYGLGAGGSYKFGNDTLVAQVNGGNGIGRYMMNSAAIEQNAIDDGSQIHLWKAVGAHVGYTHVWDAKTRSNLVLAATRFSGDNWLKQQTQTDSDSTATPYNKKINEAFLNTFWTVAKNTEVGLEYAYGKRTNFAGDAGTQNRINATVHYSLF